MRSRKERPEGFVIYSQTLKSACLLPDDSAGRVFKAVSRFFLEQEEPEDLDLSEQIVFSLMHSDVVSSLERHTETCQRNQRIAKNRASNGHDTSRVVTTRAELN